MDNITIYCAKYLIVLPVLITGWVLLKQSKSTKVQFAAAVITAGVIALIIDKVSGKLYFDPRPFVSQHTAPLIPHAADNGFPSEHTLLAATLASVLYFYNRRWAALAGLGAVIIGVARIHALVHSPIDIIGSLVIGALSGWLGWTLAKLLVKRLNASPPA